MATAIAIAGVVLAAAGAVVLIAPVRVALEWDADGPPLQLRGEARWLFAVWRFGAASARPPDPARPPPRRKAKARSGGPAGRRLRAALLARGVVPRLIRLTADLGRLLRPRAVDGWLRIGAADPAATGLLYGAAHAAAAALHPPAGWRLRLEPDFAGASLAGRGRAAWVLRPIGVLRPIAACLVSPAAWRAAWAALRA